MKIICPVCSHEIPADLVNVSEVIAKCAECNNVFSFRDQVPSAGRERSVVERPARFSVERTPEGLTITRRWLSPKIFFLLFFCLFWNGFMAVWFTIAFTQKMYSMAAFGSIHGAVGLFLLYSVAAGFLNTTVITIARDLLSVRHGPVPWRGNKEVRRGEIRQVYSKEVVHHGKHGRSFSYEVWVGMRSGKDIGLVDGLETSEEALFFEQEIEKYLRIDDEPVTGEIPR